MESVTKTIYSLYRNTPFHQEWIVACLVGAWQGVLGERIAATCKPVTLHNSELLVEVLDPAWFSALTGMQQELLDRIRRATGGEVRRLRFRKSTLGDFGF